MQIGKGKQWGEASKKALAERGQTPNLKKGTPAAQRSPKSGPFETNRNALIWTIRSPEGATYTFRNLNLWLRENADVLPGTVDQARAGFGQIKRSRLGKTKRPVGSWKGWTLVCWEKPDEQ
ncbi:hypothetical protein ACTID9_01155 [Brevibacillus fluminis]|uniref:hypothetical protein n=1 Tax=Brevibacillus fluminis TaxID=511487 RepID=UPI003F8923F0